VRRWGRPGEGNWKGKGLIGGVRVKVLAVLCVCYPTGLEQVGLVRRRNWVAKRKGRVQKGRGVGEYFQKKRVRRRECKRYTLRSFSLLFRSSSSSLPQKCFL